MMLRLPRFDMIDEPTFAPMFAALEAIDTQESGSARDRARAAVLVMLKPFVTDEHYAICEVLALGQLQAIRDHWQAQTDIPLGEYAASRQSSTESTEAPSNTISSAPAITDATSDAA